MRGEWYWSGCPVCGYAEHTPSPSERCPNDGRKLTRLRGTVDAPRRLERAHTIVEQTIELVGEAV